MNNKFTHNWEGIRFFLTYRRSKNIEDAAKKLNVSTATVSRKIAELEDVLGRPLMIRSPSGVVLAEGIDDLIKTWEEIERLVDITFSGKTSEQSAIKKTISFSTVPSIAYALLFNNLKSFLDKNKGVDIKIDTSIATLDFYADNIDIALRFVRPEKGNLVVQKKGELSFGAYYSKALGDEETVIAAIKSGNIPFIHWLEQPQYVAQQKYHYDLISSEARTIRINNFSSLLESIENGCGIGAIPHLVGERLKNVSYLSRDMFWYKSDLWLVTEKNSLKYPHIREFKEFIQNLIEAHKDKLML